MKAFKTTLFGASPRTSHTISQGSKKTTTSPSNPQRKAPTTHMGGLPSGRGSSRTRCASCR